MRFNPYKTEGVGGKSLKSFINSIKVDYNYWLLNNDDFYPECCTTATKLLFGFMAQHYSGLSPRFGNYRSIKTGMLGSHIWLKTNEGILDFVLFQFYLQGGLVPASPEIIFNSYTKNLQGDVFIEDKQLLKGYDEVTEELFVEYLIYGTDGKESFFSYLNRVSKIPAFNHRHTALLHTKDQINYMLNTGHNVPRGVVQNGF
jgi:hypothetical protein